MHPCVYMRMYGRPERAAAACLVAAHLADPAAAERRDAETKTGQVSSSIRFWRQSNARRDCW